MGLFGKPTVVNNVETLINVLLIVQLGGERYATIGTPGSAGPRLFCLSGHVNRPGVYEVVFGTTLRQLIELGGGVSGSGNLQAVLLGGAAGTFVSPAELDTPLTFEGVRAVGASLDQSGWRKLPFILICAKSSCVSQDSSGTNHAGNVFPAA